MKINLQFFGGRGGSSSGGGGGGASRNNPANMPTGTRIEMGGYKFTKTAPNKWRTTQPNGRRTSDRTDADIRRVLANATTRWL